VGADHEGPRRGGAGCAAKRFAMSTARNAADLIVAIGGLFVWITN